MQARIETLAEERATYYGNTYYLLTIQARIETLAEERAATKAAVDDIKYSGGSAQGSRQEVDQWERKLSDGQAAGERVKARQARFGRVFVDVRAGIEHMAGKLEAVEP